MNLIKAYEAGGLAQTMSTTVVCTRLFKHLPAIFTLLDREHASPALLGLLEVHAT